MPLIDIDGNINDKDLDDNFNFLLGEVNSLKSTVSDLNLNSATKSEIVREIDLVASNIVNDTVGVSGYAVSNALLGLKNRIDNILTNQDLDPNKDSELVDIRDSAYYGQTFTVADDRIENIETQKAEETLITNSYALDLQKAYGEVKTIDDGQDASLWINGTPTDDITDKKIGIQSVQFTTINGTINPTYNNLASVNFEELNNGVVSSSDDYLVVEFNVDSDVVIISIEVRLSSDAVQGANYLYKSLSDITSGFKQYSFKKSELLIAGSGADLSDIQSISYEVVATGVTNANHQYIQLVKADSSLTYPNPLASQGWSINFGEWFVGEEFGKIVLKELSTTNNRLAIQNDKTYSDFIASAEISSGGGSGNYTGFITWGIDLNNHVSLNIENDIFLLRVIESGVVTEFSKTLDISLTDVVNFEFEKNGNDLIARAYLNGEINNSVQVKGNTTLTEGNLFLGNRHVSGLPTIYSSTSITEIAHAHHSDIAEVAKSLTAQSRCLLQKNISQTIPNSASTEIVWDIETSDNNGIFDLENPTVLTIRENGLYYINTNILYEGNSNGYRIISLSVNGVNVTNKRFSPVGSEATYLNTSIVLELKKGDLIRATTLQTAGVSLDLILSGKLPRIELVKWGE